MTNGNVPSPPMLGELGPRDFASRGERYAKAHRVTGPLRIGYGREMLQDGTNFWGTPSHVAVIGNVDAGGPRVLAGACPITTGTPRWQPVFEHSDEFTYEDRSVPFLDMVMLIATGGLLIEPPVELFDTNPRFFEWLGFLVELREHREGFEV